MAVVRGPGHSWIFQSQLRACLTLRSLLSGDKPSVPSDPLSLLLHLWACRVHCDWLFLSFPLMKADPVQLPLGTLLSLTAVWGPRPSPLPGSSESPVGFASGICKVGLWTPSAGQKLSAPGCVCSGLAHLCLQCMLRPFILRSRCTHMKHSSILSLTPSLPSSLQL